MPRTRTVAGVLRHAAPAYRRALAVVAHPDDESFGMGAVLSAFSAGGTETSVLCFTHGEASTLHGADADLRQVRAREFEHAAAVLGVARTQMLEYPDGGLSTIALAELEAQVGRLAGDVATDVLLVFDDGGITGHPDHCRATEAALAVGRAAGLDVLAWALPEAAATILNAEFGTSFLGRPEGDMDVRLAVDRRDQRWAIAGHASQSVDNPVLWRRLDLLGDTEWLRFLHSVPSGTSHPTGAINQPA
jgi:N-acetylglucosamine malate deacetylase 2